MNTVLKLDKLTKRYGRLIAVDELSLSVPKGSVFGILGPNGSGKTTTLGMVLGVLHKTGGNFEWFGEDNLANSLQQVGSILETPNFFPYLSGRDNLSIIAEIKNAPAEAVNANLERVGLLDRAKDKFKFYSLGMKQRLAIAAALIGNPEVLIFDEPTNGLDPQGIADIRSLIMGIAAEGKTIILASHLLDEVEKVCSDVVILKKGKKMYSGAVKDMLEGKERIKLASTDMDLLERLLKENPDIKSMERVNDFIVIELKEYASEATINKYLIHNNITLSHISKDKGSLEKEILNLLK